MKVLRCLEVNDLHESGATTWLLLPSHIFSLFILTYVFWVDVLRFYFELACRLMTRVFESVSWFLSSTSGSDSWYPLSGLVPNPCFRFYRRVWVISSVPDTKCCVIILQIIFQKCIICRTITIYQSQKCQIW